MPEIDAQVSVAEIHALGRGAFALGAAVAFHPCLFDGKMVPFEIEGVKSAQR